MPTLKDFHKMSKIKEAAEMQGSPLRDAMVVKINDEYYATTKWEVNPDNGYLTVQLSDGNILPTRPDHWSNYFEATDFFNIEKSQIKVDRPNLPENVVS